MKSIIIFDTSGLNWLADDAESSCLEAGLKSAFLVRQTETSIGEIAATTKSVRRKQLLDLSRRLLSAGDCIYPYHWITTELIKAHQQSPANFEWKTVDVRFPEAERELALQEIFDDELASKQRDNAREQNAQFVSIFTEARPAFEELFARTPSERPADLHDLVKRLQEAGGAFWGYGKMFYERVTGSKTDEEIIRNFIEACPPFRALVIAMCIAQYEYSIRKQHSPERYEAGAFDLYCAGYLPYCDKFVTSDPGQREALGQVATIGELGARVISFDDLKSGMKLNVPPVHTASASG